MSLAVVDTDIQRLQLGIPPEHADFLQAMTLGRAYWLDYVRDYYLNGYILAGGSKVKVLVGAAGSGKTHLLRSVQVDATHMGYSTVYLSGYDMALNDLVGFYRTVVAGLDLDALVHGLAAGVIRHMGYAPEEIGVQPTFVQTLYEQERLTRELAERAINKAIGTLVAGVDLGSSFRTFVHEVVRNRLILGQEEAIALALSWLRGDKLERKQKQALGLYERLQPSNARYWLNALVHLLRLAGIPGLVVLLDDGQAIAGRKPDSHRYRYSPQAAKDICEFFRQLIDDGEWLEHMLVLVAGRPEMIEDEKRGFKSYDALWMRLQTGLLSADFNPLADVLNTERHVQAQGEDFPEQVQHHLRSLLQAAGLTLGYHGLPTIQHDYPLRARVKEVAALVEEA
ncbi:MAG: hypothetical protein OHK0012_00240 [Synechococcales cyanobacterium]